MSDLMYVHTTKAASNGAPANRLYLVTGYAEDDPKYLQAWKCTITKEGVEHPGFNKPLSMEQIIHGEGRKIEYPNGSMATAFFKPDSFYKKILNVELAQRISGSKILTRKTQRQRHIETIKSLYAKSTKNEQAAIQYAMSHIMTDYQGSLEWLKGFEFIDR